MNNVLYPTDLSETAQRGMAYAEHMAARFIGSVSLLHVLDKHAAKGKGAQQAKEVLEAHRAMLDLAPVDVLLREGEFMQEIAEESKSGHVLMVCSTHGPRGLKQSLFGANILKLVRKVAIPTLVVQKHSPQPNT